MSWYPLKIIGDPQMVTDVTAVTCDIMYPKRITIVPAAAGTVAIHANVNCTGTAAQTVTTAISNPDVPRNLTVKSTSTDDTSGDVTITGTDYNAAAISETIAVNGTAPVHGTLAFKTVGTIVYPANLAGSVGVGSGTRLGLPDLLAAKCQILGAVFDGTLNAGLGVGLGTAYVSSATLAANMYTPGTTAGSAYNGTKSLTILYLDGSV